MEERDLYGRRVCFDLLDRLENHGNREPTDTSRYSIEHVMPQNEQLPREWQEMLGEQWPEVHRQWLHRLGNLTLTGYNSVYSDRPFSEKKTIAGGFADSSVRLNRFIRESRVWTAAKLEQRGKDLAHRALSIWPPLVVDSVLIDAAKQEEMRNLARRRDVASVEMSSRARELFDLIRTNIQDIDEDIIELAEQKSVSYHGPAFFLEVLMRKHDINLLLALDFNEVEDPAGVALDASQRKFFVCAAHDGGVNIIIREPADVDKAMPLVRQAHAVASA